MSQTKEDNIDIGEKLGNAEKYVSDNKKSLSIIGGSIIAVEILERRNCHVVGFL